MLVMVGIPVVMPMLVMVGIPVVMPMLVMVGIPVVMVGIPAVTQTRTPKPRRR